MPPREPSGWVRGGRLTAPAVGLIALLLGLLFSQSNLGQRLDGQVFDRLASVLGSPRPATGIVVVLITEKDYNSAKTPMALWGLHLAPLLNKISADRPTALGIDLIFPRFPLRKLVKEHDPKIFKALKAASKKTRLVSGYGLRADGSTQGPFIIYQRILGAEGLGYFNLTPDPDGVCRRQTMALTGSQDRHPISFPALLAGLKPSPGTIITPDWRNPARIKTSSHAQALAAPTGFFKDKTVIIGVDFDFEDRHPSPLPGPPEPGVVFHARVVESILSGRSLTYPGPLAAPLIPALTVILAILAATRRTAPVWTVIVSLVALLALVGLCAGVLAGGTILTPSAGLIGLLVATLGRLVGGYLAVKETFGRYVNAEIRDEILKGRVPLDGEHRYVSVLFCDLRNFTPMVESSDPKEVVRTLNGYYHEMATAIRSNHGLVMQYVGDEVYAAFGAPLEDEDHARHAVRAGLAMRRRLAEFNRRQKAAGRPELDHGIGVHTGDVLVATIGGPGRVTYTFIGDTVNLASRLQGLNKELGTKMIISGVTRGLIDGDRITGAKIRRLPDTSVKGKSKPIVIYEVREDSA